MAFKARLNFSGKKYEVLHHAYALNRDIDIYGMRYSKAHSYHITTKIKSGKIFNTID